MILSEYDEELHINSEKKISYEEGGGRRSYRASPGHPARPGAGERADHPLAAAGRAGDIIRSAEDSAYQEQLFQEFGI